MQDSDKTKRQVIEELNVHLEAALFLLYSGSGRPHELMINNTHVTANFIPDTRYSPILVKEIGNAKNQIPIQAYPF